MTNRKGLIGIAVVGIMVILIGATLSYLVLSRNDGNGLSLPVTIIDYGFDDEVEDPIVIIRQIKLDENEGNPVVSQIGDIDAGIEDSEEVQWGELIDKVVRPYEDELVYENLAGYCVGVDNPVILVTSNHNYYDLLVEGNALVIRNFNGIHSKETVTVECDGVETDFILTTCFDVDFGFGKIEVCGE